MENQNGSVNLSKPVKTETQPWTDPATGEIYPGGNPNFARPAPNAGQPLNGSVQPNFAAYPAQQPQYAQTQNIPNGAAKFCSHCGGVIAKEAVVCPMCGCQVANIQTAAPQQPIIINNNNNNNVAYAPQQVVYPGRAKNKWVAFLLCFFLGYLGIHRFYEGKIGTGILYFFTAGLFGIGWLVDWIIILTKPNPYYV